MLGGPSLVPAGCHAAAATIACVDCAAGLVAVGQAGGPTLLFSDGNFGAVIELPLPGRPGEGASALAFSLAGDVLLLGSPGGGVFRLHLQSSGTQLEEVELVAEEGGEKGPRAPVSAIVRQEAADIFAVACGRRARRGGGGPALWAGSLPAPAPPCYPNPACKAFASRAAGQAGPRSKPSLCALAHCSRWRRCVYVLDAGGAVHTKIGPLSDPLLQLVRGGSEGGRACAVRQPASLWGAASCVQRAACSGRAGGALSFGSNLGVGPCAPHPPQAAPGTRPKFKQHCPQHSSGWGQKYVSAPLGQALASHSNPLPHVAMLPGLGWRLHAHRGDAGRNIPLDAGGRGAPGELLRPAQ